MNLQDATRLVWYFGFVSPYSYLQFASYPELVREAGLRPHRRPARRRRAQALKKTA